MTLDDTIVAVSTPHGRGGISVIRISGADAIKIAGKIFKPKYKLKTESFTPYKNYSGEIISSGGEVLDEVLLFTAKSPNSFTGDDTAEISCHGNPLIVNDIISLICGHSARPALPGEFTKRAFLNGRIDLTKAEAVIDTINAKTTASLKLAKSALSGKLAKKIDSLRQKMITLLAFLEAAIDYSEEDIQFLTREEINAELEDIIVEFDDLTESYERGKFLKNGVKIAIVGAPNSGKSSLLNALTGKERAIVSEYAGTTRDTVDAEISLNGLLAVIIDTAGIRHTTDPIEKIGVERTHQSIEEADHVVLVIDGSEEITPETAEIFKLLKDKKYIIALNKSDIERKINACDIENILGGGVICQEISCITGIGIKELTNKLVDDLGLHYDSDEIILTTVFQKNQISSAKNYVLKAISELKKGSSEEFLASDLTEAAAELAKITGANINNELLNELFGRFCVGK